MKKVLAKLAEMYAKSSTTSCYVWFFHAPRAPRSLIK